MESNDQINNQSNDQVNDQVNNQSNDQVNNQSNDQVNDQVNNQSNDQLFSLFEQLTPVKHNIDLIIEPNSNVTSYFYTIYKDEKPYRDKNVDNNESSFITLSETGKYEIVVYELIDGEKLEVKSGIYNIDKESPIIETENLFLTMQQGATLDVMGGVRAYDNQDGDLTNKLTSNASELDFTTLGLKKLVYSVSDEAGNTTIKTVNINVVRGTTSSLVAVQSVIIGILIVILLLVLYFRKSINYEKRFAKFVVEPIYDKSMSLSDKISNFYYKILVRIKNVISGFTTIKKYAKKYDKYVNIVNRKYEDGLDFVASKIVMSFLLIFVAIFSKSIQYQLLRVYEISLPLLAGFFIPDIIYAYTYKRYCSTIENDLLQAIMIMNNAFKSGRSIIQAIDLVTTELDGPISDQFKKLYMEINLGLSLEDAFKRLQERIPLEEVSYLTASITILNKTGGNIIKVFTSIENTLFNKKKLKLELKSLTGSSRVISYVLFGVPILFALFITLLDSTYFVPFFTTTLGLILLAIMLIIYSLYIVFVIKIMKVKL